MALLEGNTLYAGIGLSRLHQALQLGLWVYVPLAATSNCNRSNIGLHHTRPANQPALPKPCWFGVPIFCQSEFAKARNPFIPAPLKATLASDFANITAVEVARDKPLSRTNISPGLSSFPCNTSAPTNEHPAPVPLRLVAPLLPFPQTPP